METQEQDPASVPQYLAQHGHGVIQEHLMHIIEYAKRNKDKADRSWPVLLKSNTFFLYIVAYLAGVRRGSVDRNVLTAAYPQQSEFVE